MTKIHAKAEGLTAHIRRSARRMSRYHGPGREIPMNGADAGATRLQVDGYELPDGRPVMRITDNGSGMTSVAMRTYMLTLFESGEDRKDNHGGEPATPRSRSTRSVLPGPRARKRATR